MRFESIFCILISIKSPAHARKNASVYLIVPFQGVQMTFPPASVQSVSNDALFGQIIHTLDDAQRHLQSERYVEAIELLYFQLSALHDKASAASALSEARNVARGHPAFRLCHLDPFTERAYRKPRGYAGDAVMLDYVYSGHPPCGTHPVGQGIFRCTTRGPTGLSVLYRRSLLASYINEVITRNPAARILSVASGHCRELEGTLATSRTFQGEVIAFDQDPASCDEVRRVYPKGVKTVEGNVKRLVGGHIALGDFDLIYSAGLYDYLPSVFAQRLTETLKGMLRPKGRLIIGNFARGTHARGYLDLVMDWHLVYRNTTELLQLLGDTTGFRLRTFGDPHNNVVYGELAAP